MIGLVEIDAIVERPSGEWLAAEIKLGGDQASRRLARGITARPEAQDLRTSGQAHPVT